MKVRFEVPPASAKRMEKNRQLVVEAYSIGMLTNRIVYPIAEGLNYVEFDHEEPDQDLHNERADLDYVHSRFFIEFRNTTGSKLDRVQMFLD